MFCKETCFAVFLPLLHCHPHYSSQKFWMNFYWTLFGLSQRFSISRAQDNKCSMLRGSTEFVSTAAILNQGQFCLLGAFGNGQRHIWLSQLGVVVCYWNPAGRSQGCCKHLVCTGTPPAPPRPPPPQTENDSTPNVNALRLRNPALWIPSPPAHRTWLQPWFSAGYKTTGMNSLASHSLFKESSTILESWNLIVRFHYLGPAKRCIFWEETRVTS